MDHDHKDRYGRTTFRGQFNMIFSYLSGEENDYQTVQFWFEKHKMVTSLSYNTEDDEFNGEQVKRISELKRKRDQMLEEEGGNFD
eukprot:435054-Amphidinium_carterae.1